MTGDAYILTGTRYNITCTGYIVIGTGYNLTVDHFTLTRNLDITLLSTAPSAHKED
ncbi:MAG: hypothetical protein GTO45_24760 [Candidatus Aminicenantes bacterium]|nr:hypothetical protein [Candidatus Aminicenantes bacterium]NIM77667.1 hypothetical protein [Candidatus Aminicenantes bacterium]NIN21344.1 hypothetical protein [Candidatus Aminicenantes bacterium]NIN45165.1 hypothetical protein [Candidatus Aminicenantes bacterium]NIN87982.1 hypothetical protein [Candidatus Aminicenantes bacterium]